MKYVWDTNNQPKLVKLHIKTAQPEKLLIAVYDAHKPTYYSKQETTVNGKDTFEISLPITPKRAFFEIKKAEKANNSIPDFGSPGISYSIEELPFKRVCNFTSKPLLNSFMKFSDWFAANASIHHPKDTATFLPGLFAAVIAIYAVRKHRLKGMTIALLCNVVAIALGAFIGANLGR